MTVKHLPYGFILLPACRIAKRIAEAPAVVDDGSIYLARLPNASITGIVLKSDNKRERRA